MARERQGTREEWQLRLARWKHSSSMTTDEFAAREGVSRGQLTWWVGRLRTLEREGPAPGPAFVELEPSSTGLGVEVVLRGGVVVRVPVGFDGDTVSRLVRVLEEVTP